MFSKVFHQPWRTGWLGRLLRQHSVSAEYIGLCWCQKNIKDSEMTMARITTMALLKDAAERKPSVDEGDSSLTTQLPYIPFNIDTHIKKDPII